MNGSSAVAITALSALADKALNGDDVIDAICERIGVDLNRDQISHARAVLAGAAKHLVGHLHVDDRDVAQVIVTEDAWAATTAEVTE